MALHVFVLADFAHAAFLPILVVPDIAPATRVRFANAPVPAIMPRVFLVFAVAFPVTAALPADSKATVIPAFQAASLVQQRAGGEFGAFVHLQQYRCKL